ncbi:uncharacterized protein LOC129000000 isoform X3 [Macrosteles quadrilineatus]|uniref:uncharacterized protein LOC129000000 isoform X3 n=1 Tax=Macrosteles quadrilineatus TaxID=74068 RepID=UPI0023E09728|nr:uncharacterized protein LOC129000000 isoform X3 [Macrosteles quadrilineatus]
MSGRVSRTKPNCARCRNHGIQVPIKDHKLFCKWKKCICDKCSRTAERQQIMAKQTRIRRAEEVVSNLAKKGLPVPERVLTPPPESPLNVDDSLDSNYSACASPATGSAPPSPPRQQPRLTPPPRPFHDATDLWKSIVKLIETCHLPLNISPLLYIIFTEITPNPDEVIKRIKAATEMLHSIPRLLEMCMMPDSTIPLLIIILTEVTPNADAVFLRMKMGITYHVSKSLKFYFNKVSEDFLNQYNISDVILLMNIFNLYIIYYGLNLLTLLSVLLCNLRANIYNLKYLSNLKNTRI